MADEIRLACTLDREYLSANLAEQMAYLLIDITPSDTVAGVSMPLNLCLVLDRSASMLEENKLDNLKSSVKRVIDAMQSHDQVSIVTFDTTVQLDAATQAVGDGRALHAIVDNIFEGGGTRMSLGMQQGLEQLKSSRQAGQVVRMLLLTDGETQGDEGQCIALAGQCQQLGIPITALGLGNTWNERLLYQIANLTQGSGGRAGWIDRPDKIQEMFLDTLTSMQRTAVTNARLTLRFVEGMRFREIWRVLPRVDLLQQFTLSPTDVQVALADVEKGEGQSVLVELMPRACPAGTWTIAQAEVRYDVPANGLIDQLARENVVITFTDAPPGTARLNPRVERIKAEAQAAMLQTHALRRIEQGDEVGGTRLLMQSAEALRRQGHEDLATQALQSAEEGQTKILSKTSDLRKLETRRLQQ